jgi:precorrin-8X/cobalt-precorrin-8 methylmutase
VRLFDVFVMVDWSSASTPTRGADSIWSATLDVATGDASVVNHATRAAAFSAVRATLVDAAGRRVLVGFDFPYGYPAGSATALGLDPGCRDPRCLDPTCLDPRCLDPTWRSLWRELTSSITDDERNRNNRFDVAAQLNARLGDGPGPFWGCPRGRDGGRLSTHKHHAFPHLGLAEYREPERRLRASGRHAFSVWQTAYAGSVGGQALVGIPVLQRLVGDPGLSSRSQVWPFTTGFVADPTAGGADTIVHAEIWPGAIDVDRALHAVKDAAQVLSLCRWAAALDAVGGLKGLFAPALPADVAATAVREEGWVLGVT